MKLDVMQATNIAYNEMHDYMLIKHSMDVGMLCLGTAKKLPLNDEDTRLVHCAGILHDIGKTRPNTNLTHSEMSYNILIQYDPDVAQIAVCHHTFQKFPIPDLDTLIGVTDHNRYLGQIVAICDKVDAYMSRNHKSPKNAFYEANKDGIFDQIIKDAVYDFVTMEHKRNH